MQGPPLQEVGCLLESQQEAMIFREVKKGGRTQERVWQEDRRLRLEAGVGQPRGRELHPQPHSPSLGGKDMNSADLEEHPNLPCFPSQDLAAFHNKAPSQGRYHHWLPEASHLIGFCLSPTKEACGDHYYTGGTPAQKGIAAYPKSHSRKGQSQDHPSDILGPYSFHQSLILVTIVIIITTTTSELHSL